MTASRKARPQKHVSDTASKRSGKELAKDAAPAQPFIPAEMEETENLPLVNSPYQLFAPLFELLTTPWRLFFPYTPWPIVRLQRPKDK